MSDPIDQDGMQIQLNAAELTALQHLKTVDFELGYLALLTQTGLKPVSRWEKALNRTETDALHELGLQTRTVGRRVRSGKKFTETLFGRTPAYLEVYAEHFEGLAVDKSAETVRVEGFLFGYPPCCVAQYIRHPYAPSEFPTHKQEILFHWSCKGCVVTPLLAPLYEKLHQFTLRC